MQTNREVILENKKNISMKSIIIQIKTQWQEYQDRAGGGRYKNDNKKQLNTSYIHQEAAGERRKKERGRKKKITWRPPPTPPAPSSHLACIAQSQPPSCPAHAFLCWLHHPHHSLPRSCSRNMISWACSHSSDLMCVVRKVQRRLKRMFCILYKGCQKLSVVVIGLQCAKKVTVVVIVRVVVVVVVA